MLYPSIHYLKLEPAFELRHGGNPRHLYAAVTIPACLTNYLANLAVPVLIGLSLSYTLRKGRRKMGN